MHHEEAPFEVAIVGGGIVGVTLAAGLARRNIKVKLFEQAKNFGEIGVGIGFTSNTVRCMQQINPDIVDALRQGGAVPNNAFRYLDGFAQPDPDQRRLAFLDAGPMGWETVRRDMFLMELVKRVPQEVFRLNSRLANVEQDGEDGKVLLTFEDGTTHSTDAVISCDGIKSKTRRILLGPNDPATPPQYTHKCAYRTLVPIEKVREALGEYKTRHLHFHLGPGAHLLHYPVNSKMVGSAVYVHDPKDWPLNGPMTAQGKREDVIQAVAGWSEPIQKLVKLFPETLEKWALFDMYEYPLRQYNWDRIALAGDAAHASSPHHGAGASFGIEDVLCLSTLLEDATTAVKGKQVNKNQALKLAFQSYDAIRRTRTQWLVNSSRRTCNLYQQEEWGDPTRTVKAETCFEEVRDRSYKIWNFDSVGMVNDTTADYAKRLKEHGSGTNGHSAKHSDLKTNGVANGISNGVANGVTNGHTNSHTNGHTNGTTNGVSNGVTKAPTYDWLVNIPDMPNKMSDRLANLQIHMANSKKQLESGKLVMAGPAFSSSDIQNQSQKPGMTGSVQVIRGRDAEEVLQSLGQDPFAKLGVWDLDRATLQPMRVGLMQPPTV